MAINDDNTPESDLVAAQEQAAKTASSAAAKQAQKLSRRTPNNSSNVVIPESFRVAAQEQQNTDTAQRQRELLRRRRGEVTGGLSQVLQQAAETTQGIRAGLDQQTTGEAATTTAETAADGGAATTAANSTGDTEGGGKTYSCPFCTESNGEPGMLVQFVGRAYESITGWFQRTLGIRLPTEALQYFKERAPIPKANLIKECKFCRNKRTGIKDPGDSSKGDAAAAALLKANASKIEQAEAKSGYGGHAVITCNNLMVRAGEVPNRPPAGTVLKIPCANPGYGGLPGSQDFPDGQSTFGGPLVGKAHPYYKRIPTPKKGYGHIHLEACEDMIFTTAQDMQIIAGGPMQLNSPMTQVIASELTLGGTDAVINCEGSICRFAADVEIRGNAASDPKGLTVVGPIHSTAGVQANSIAAEHGAVISMVMPGKKEYIDGGSGTNTYDGPAFWGGPAGEGVIAATRQVLSVGLMQGAAHPKFLQQLTSPRYWFNVADSVTNLAYAARPVEVIPTGVTFTLGIVPGLVWNWPHIHAMADDPHVHEHTVPNIELLDDAKAVRKRIPRTSAPIHNKQVSLYEAAESVVRSIAQIVTGAANQLGTFFK